MPGVLKGLSIRGVSFGVRVPEDLESSIKLDRFAFHVFFCRGNAVDFSDWVIDTLLKS